MRKNPRGLLFKEKTSVENVKAWVELAWSDRKNAYIDEMFSVKSRVSGQESHNGVFLRQGPRSITWSCLPTTQNLEDWENSYKTESYNNRVRPLEDQLKIGNEQLNVSADRKYEMFSMKSRVSDQESHTGACLRQRPWVSTWSCLPTTQQIWWFEVIRIKHSVLQLQS